MKNNRPVPIAIYINKIPRLFEEFIDLAGRNIIMEKGLSKKHKFSSAVNFYFKNKDKNWHEVEVPKFVIDAVNEIGNFVFLKSVLLSSSRGKPIKALLRAKAIGTFSVEAMIASHYVRRGFLIRWLSVFSKDPPDLVIYDPSNKIAVDVEVKIKEGNVSVETMFDSLSRGLQSLKRRDSKSNERAIVVIHNSDDLHWVEWLRDPDVTKRLISRLENDEYKIVSGIVFSGGELVINEKDGGQQYHTKFVAFRSNAATCQLPKRFLTGSGNI